jgi:hypothetical protein
MSASNFGKKKEPFKHYPQVVERAGNDRLQQDLVKLIQKKYLLTSEQEAIHILQTYADTIENIVRKTKKPVNISPVPIMTGSFVANNLSVSLPGNSFPKDFEPAQPLKETEEETIPVLYGCHNVVTNLRTVMSGSVMQLYGLNLDINKQDTEQGLYLVDFSGNTTKINTLVRVKSTNIIFMIPGGLTANIYRLEIRKRAFAADMLHTSLLPGFIRVIV